MVPGLDKPAVETRGLSLAYGPNTALENVTMAIERRNITALIGPSGCGKTTLLRCINRMNDEVAGVRVTGRVLVEGVDIYGAGIHLEELRKRVGMVFQKSNPFPMSIAANITFGPRMAGPLSRDRAAEIVERSLQLAGLWEEVRDRLERSALDLSGGQQQRLCIARALAVRPKILLMDEPCSALDPKASDRIEHTARELAEELTVILVTHNLQQAGRVSDSVAVLLAGGELAEFGPTKSVFESPEDERVADYLSGRFG